MFAGLPDMTGYSPGKIHRSNAVTCRDDKKKSLNVRLLTAWRAGCAANRVYGKVTSIFNSVMRWATHRVNGKAGLYRPMIRPMYT